MADEGKGTAANSCSSSRKRNSDGADRSGNRKKKNISSPDFVDNDVEVEEENGSGDDDDDDEVEEGNVSDDDDDESEEQNVSGDDDDEVEESEINSHKAKPQKTFWTECHGCKMHYEYLRMYLNRSLLCLSCREPFLAAEITPPFRKVSTDDVEVEDDTEINIKTAPTGKIIPLKLKRSDTIRRIKCKIQTMEGIPSEQQELFFKEKVLEDISTLVNLRIKNKSTLTLMRKSRGLINIFVKTPEGKIIGSFEVKPTDTIGDVKRKIYVARPVLIFNDNVLEDSGILADLHIIEGSTLTLAGKAKERMKIYVKTFTGKTISLLVDPQSRIRDVKWEIESKEDIPSDEQALIYNKMFLADTDTLNDLRIKRKSTFTLMRQSSRSMKIFLKTPMEEIFTVNGEPSDTIEEIKSQFHNKVSHPFHDVVLIYNEMVLHNDDTLADFNINKASTLTLIPSSSGSMHLFVKTLHGNTVMLDVKPSYTIRNVKSMIRDKEGVPTGKYKLVYEGTQLDDGDTLANYRIFKESTLEILL